MTELVAPFVPVHGSWTFLPDMISYPEGRSTIHEPGRRELPTQSYIRLLSWLDTNLSHQEPEEEDLVPASSDEGL